MEVVMKKARSCFKTANHSSTAFKEAFCALQESLKVLTAENTGLHESLKTRPLSPKFPVTHINICEKDYMAVGIFVLHENAKLPLHDHPGMHGILKVIHGTVCIRSYNVLSKTTVIQSRAVPSIHYAAEKMPPVLANSSTLPLSVYPESCNVHEIEFVKGEKDRPYAAFLDILSPPYYTYGDNPKCNYYSINEDEISKTELKINSGVKNLCHLRKIRCPSYYNTDSVTYCGPNVDKVTGDDQASMDSS